MKTDKTHKRGLKDGVRATLDFLARFGFVLFIAIVFIMLTFAVAFSQRKGNQQVDPKTNAAVKIATGDTYAKQGNGGKAVSSYEEAASLDPQNPLPHYKIGEIYLRSGNKDAAMEAFQKAISVDATYAAAYKEIAELYYMQKNGAEAVKAQEKYLEFSTSRDDGLVRLGYYTFMTRDFLKTNGIFKEAYEKGLLKDTDLRYYGLSLVEAEDYSGAQKILEEYLSKKEGEASDYTAYAKTLVQLKQDSLAVLALEKSLSLDNRQTGVKKMLWETLYALGKSYYSRKMFAEADTTFEKLIGLHPSVATGYLWAGRANAQLDPETEKGLAKDFYEKVIEISKSKTDLKEAHAYLGYYYFVKKDVPQSRANWEKVLTIDPKDSQAIEALKAIKQ